MTLAITLSVIAGIAIGFRFKVVMVMPVMIAAALATTAFATSAADHFWSMASTAALSAIAVQAGYVCGTFAASMREAPAAAITETVGAPSNAYRSRNKLSA